MLHSCTSQSPRAPMESLCSVWDWYTATVVFLPPAEPWLLNTVAFSSAIERTHTRILSIHIPWWFHTQRTTILKLWINLTAMALVWPDVSCFRTTLSTLCYTPKIHIYDHVGSIFDGYRRVTAAWLFSPIERHTKGLYRVHYILSISLFDVGSAISWQLWYYHPHQYLEIKYHLPTVHRIQYSLSPRHRGSRHSGNLWVSVYTLKGKYTSMDPWRYWAIVIATLLLAERGPLRAPQSSSGDRV